MPEINITRERILVIKLSALGDFMLALGPMAAIRNANPEAHITLLTTRPFLDLAQRCGYFNDILIDRRPKFYDVAGWLTLFRMLNRVNYTKVFDLQMNDRSGVYVRMLIQKPAFTLPTLPELPNEHAFDRFRRIFAAAGMEIARPDLGWMTADVSLFKLKKPYVLLVPGSSPQWPQKRWPALRYGALGMKLIRHGYDVGVIGTSAEREVIDRVVKSCPEIHDFSGRTSLYDIATLARGAAGAMGNDTGPLHIIALNNCPVIALFSNVSQPEISAPLGDDVKIIQSDDMGAITVDEVFANFTPRTVPAEKPAAEHQLDARGLICPLPVLKARKLLLALPPGDILRVSVTDPQAPKDFALFCTEAGHRLLDVEHKGESTDVTIQRG